MLLACWLPAADLLPSFVPYLEALRDGIKAYDEQPDVAMKAIADKTKESDPAILKKTYDFYKTTAPWEPFSAAHP